MKMTHHAQKRSQQRAIAPFVIDLLQDFGKSEPAGCGTTRIYFDKTARRRVQSYLGPLARLIHDQLDVYAIVGPEEQVITVAHLTERIRRH